LYITGTNNTFEEWKVMSVVERKKCLLSSPDIFSYETVATGKMILTNIDPLEPFKQEGAGEVSVMDFETTDNINVKADWPEEKFPNGDAQQETNIKEEGAQEVAVEGALEGNHEHLQVQEENLPVREEAKNGMFKYEPEVMAEGDMLSPEEEKDIARRFPHVKFLDAEGKTVPIVTKYRIKWEGKVSDNNEITYLTLLSLIYTTRGKLQKN
jgi:hypothetical protein